MMKKLNEHERLLRKYVENVLLEYEGDGDYGYGYGGGGGYTDLGGGGGYFSGFANVFRVLGAKSKELLARVKGAVALSLEAIGGICLPFVKAEYKEVLDKTNSEVKKLEQHHQPIYNAVAKDLADKDAKFLMFMANPTGWITGKFLETAPDVAINVADAATGGKMTGFLSKVKDAVGYATAGAALYSGASNMNSGRHYSGSRLNEDEEKKEGQIDKEKLAQILKHPKVVDFIKNNPNVQRMQADARKVIDDEVNLLLSLVSDIDKIKTLEELEKLTGKKIKAETARLQGRLLVELLGSEANKEKDAAAQQGKKNTQQGSKEAPPGESVEDLAKQAKVPQRKLDATQLAAAKKMMKDFVTKQLNEKIAAAKKAGGSDDDYMIVKYKEAISNIKGM